MMKIPAASMIRFENSRRISIDFGEPSTLRAYPKGQEGAV